MIKGRAFNSLGILVLLAYAAPAMASPILLVETAYLFELPHTGDLPDGGSVRITNLDAASVTIDHVFISGWTSGISFDFGPGNPQLCCTAAVGGPAAPPVLAPGGVGVYNEAGPPKSCRYEQLPRSGESCRRHSDTGDGHLHGRAI